MVSKIDFQDYVKTLITDDDKEGLRKAKIKFGIILSVVLILEAVGFTALALSVENQMLKIVLFIFMAVMMLISYFIVRHNHAFNWSKYKEQIMPKILNFLLKDYKYEYSMDKYIPEDVFEKSPFADKYDEYCGEDLLSINVPNDDDTPSNTWFHISDLSVTKQEERVHYVVDQYGNSHREIDHYTVSVFKGAFAHVTFPVMFKCTLGINCELNGTKKINFEDVDFNKELKTYADKELEAFLVLTPDLINKLKVLNIRTKGLKLAMYDNKLVFTMSKLNLFEFKNKKNFDESMFENFYDDITSILGIVTEIKNNNKVFKF